MTVHMHAMKSPYLEPVTPSTRLQAGDLVFFPYGADGPTVSTVMLLSTALSAALGCPPGELVAGGKNLKLMVIARALVAKVSAVELISAGMDVVALRDGITAAHQSHWLRAARDEHYFYNGECSRCGNDDCTVLEDATALACALLIEAAAP